MDQNNQIVYVLPDFSFPLDLLDTHLKLIIKSKGYNMIADAKNLLICQNIIGKITTGSEIGYSIREIEIVKFLASKGIKAIPGKKIERPELIENTWNLNKTFKNSTTAPTNVQYYTDRKGNLSLLKEANPPKQTGLFRKGAESPLTNHHATLALLYLRWAPTTL